MSEKIIKSIPIYKGKILDLQRNLVSLPNDELAFREIVKHKEGVFDVCVALPNTPLFLKGYKKNKNRAGSVD